MKEKFLLAKKYITIFFAIVSMFFGIGLPERNTKGLNGENAVRIMSFNIRNGEFEDRYKYVPRLIGEYMPDSVGVQECTFLWSLTLKMNLKEYGFVGGGRDSGGQSFDCGEMSAILYRKDKYKLVDSGTFWLSETPEKVSKGWDGNFKRICTWAVLKDKKTGYTYAHINTHLDNKGEQARVNGLEMVKSKVFSYDIPAVLTGDLNFREGTDLYNQLVSGGLKDSKYLAKNTDSGFTSHGYHADTVVNDKPIDYICVNKYVREVKNYKIIREKYDGNYISDHYPIISDMILF